MVDILIIIAGIWLAAASLTDLKKREVSDWLSFSLIAIALSIRTVESIIQWSYVPILQSILGLAGFFLLANIMYFGKLFAGGDVKLMAAIGSVIPSISFLSNVLVAGSVYGIAYSIFLALMNPGRFYKETRNYRHAFIISFLISLLLLSGYAFTANIFLLMISLAVLSIALLMIFVQSVEKSCLIKNVPPNQLTEGDWLLKDVKIRGKVIKADFEGLTKKDIAKIREANVNVLIKYGIPFIPVFLTAFLLTVFYGNIFSIFL